ncbi:NRDE family protein [Faecalibacter rhinopitheci]|uniref:NRDE family protein n=1 Tax=Faecalibacter rhinopitheci TaxID=2779678 RepID=A0A8J7FLM1_9FLAO|nr:NRDE family protein [Faecalibacter rhinopitheci]MBF0596617.1 NRDE family protein [Faecalibacter rhinopitheci]
MCIISFYKQNDEIILTHNRDESIHRIASPSVEQKFWEGNEYYAPLDEEKKGTWIFYSENYIACILNGGKEKPVETKTNYKKSRGILLLDILKYNSVIEFCKAEDLTNIAPFTILVHEIKNKKTYLLFWDEKQLNCNDLSDVNFVFRCSSTLYSFNDMVKFEKKFPKFNNISPENIMKIHYSLMMKDGDIIKGKATTSITQIFATSTKISMKYCPFF